jgi:putative transposase
LRSYRRLRVDGGTYFFTVVTADRRPIFADPLAVTLLHASIAHIRAKRPFDIDAWVVLPDHLHCLWTLPTEDHDFSTRWRQIKERFTRAWMKSSLPAQRTATMARRGEQTVWQRRFWEHLVRDEADLVAHVEYIHLNPVIHGLVELPDDWEHSSFSSFVERGEYAKSWGQGATPRVSEVGEP